MLHNLLAEELQFIHNKLNETTLQALTIHPMFVLVILMELLFNGIQEAAQVVFGDSIRLRLEANLFGNEVFKHLIEENLGIEEAAAKAFGNEQWILTALEEMEFTVKMGCKFISWCKDFELADATEYQKVRFDTAGQIICNRLEYMVNGLDLQLIRVRRAQNQSRLNRTGVSSFFLMQMKMVNKLAARNTKRNHREQIQCSYIRAKQRHSTRKQTRLVSNESHRRSNYVLPARHVRRCTTSPTHLLPSPKLCTQGLIITGLLRNATFRLVRTKLQSYHHLEILDLLGSHNTCHDLCTRHMESLV